VFFPAKISTVWYAAFSATRERSVKTSPPLYLLGHMNRSGANGVILFHAELACSPGSCSLGQALITPLPGFHRLRSVEPRSILIRLWLYTSPVLSVHRLSGDACKSTRSPCSVLPQGLKIRSPHSTILVLGCREVVLSTPSHRSSDPEIVTCFTADCRRIRLPLSGCSLRRRFAPPHDLTRLHEPSLRFNIASISTSQPPQHRRHLSIAVFSTLRSSRIRLPTVGRSNTRLPNSSLAQPHNYTKTLITLQRSPIMSCRELYASITMATV
jgi:hypothetical protein